MLGCAQDFDSQTAKILTEATLLEAEPELMKRRPLIDTLALNRLKGLCQNPVKTYGELLSLMMGETNRSDIFYKDYRRTSFGFAVIHCIEYIDFAAIASASDLSHHLPLTIIKEILATALPPWISSERIILVFNNAFYDRGFRQAASAVVLEACQAFHSKRFEMKDEQLLLRGTIT